jgi:hypothetical protein
VRPWPLLAGALVAALLLAHAVALALLAAVVVYPPARRFSVRLVRYSGAWCVLLIGWSLVRIAHRGRGPIGRVSEPDVWLAVLDRPALPARPDGLPAVVESTP